MVAPAEVSKHRLFPLQPKDIDLGQSASGEYTGPLPSWHTFVSDRLPMLNQEIQSGSTRKNRLTATITTMLQESDTSTLEAALRDPQEPRIYLLEMLHSCAAHDITPPEKLVQLAQTFSTAAGLLPVLTYHDLLYNRGDRTFLPRNTSAGEAEWRFYEIHRLIERRFQIINNTIIQATDTLRSEGTKGIDEATTMIQSVGILPVSALEERFQRKIHPIVADQTSPVDTIIDLTKQVGRQMEKSDFNSDTGFRPFFNVYKTAQARELKGPSGKFSPTVPAFELAVIGDVLPTDRHQHTQTIWDYFSSGEQRDLAAAYDRARSGYTLDKVCADLGDPEPIVSLVKGALLFLATFRLEHYKGALLQIPEAAREKVFGTGGENVQQFLDTRYKSTLTLFQRPRIDPTPLPITS